MAAVSKVFDTSELFEAILSFATPSTIITCRRLNAYSKTVIDKSPLLSKRIYLKPDESVPRGWWHIMTGYGVAGSQVVLYKAINTSPSTDQRDLGERHVLNDLLFTLPCPDDKYDSAAVFRAPLAEIKKSIRESASLDSFVRRMQIASPPLKAVDLFVDINPDEDSTTPRVTRLVDEDGVKFGAVIEGLKVYPECKTAFLMVHMEIFTTEETRREIEDGM